MGIKVTSRTTSDGERFFKELAELNKLEVRVGFQDDMKPKKKDENKVNKAEEEKKEPANYAEIALYNDLGTVNSPSRPFMRNSVDLHQDEIKAVAQEAVMEIISGGTAREVLEVVGNFLSDLMIEEIEEGNYEANSQSTISRKGSAHPLIDTGGMKNSIRSIVKEKGGND